MEHWNLVLSPTLYKGMGRRNPNRYTGQTRLPYTLRCRTVKVPFRTSPWYKGEDGKWYSSRVRFVVERVLSLLCVPRMDSNSGLGSYRVGVVSVGILTAEG